MEPSQEYLSQISDENLISLLLKKEKISALEELLFIESKKLELFRKKKRRFDLGRKINYEELPELFSEVKEEIDNFLDIKNVTFPNIKYSSLFDKESMLFKPFTQFSAFASYSLSAINFVLLIEDPSLTFVNGLLLLNGTLSGMLGMAFHSKANYSAYFPYEEFVRIKKEKRELLIPDLAHEYTHHIQLEKNLGGKKTNIFLEGHARGVQRYISEIYREKENNDTFMQKILDYDVGEIKSSYTWASEKLKIPLNKNLLKIKTSRDEDEREHNKERGMPTEHAVGNALFLTYEKEYGNKIYREMIHENFQFK